MNALLIIIVSYLGFVIAYNTYGKFLAKKIFKLNPNSAVPSKTHEDGEDFVPSKKHIVFGHHFTSIAGTGPIVGPAIGVIWGWVPALIWVVLGSIFIGAVHDFSALVISLRNDGKSISDIAEKYINKRVRLLFFLVVFLGLLIVIAIFGLVIAIIFARFPYAVIPVWLEIPIAIWLGRQMLSKSKSILSDNVATWSAKLLMLGTFFLGYLIPIKLGVFLGVPPTGVWTIILLLYAFIASILPVTTLLQPRDYLNAWQLYAVLAVLILGTIATSIQTDLVMTAPALNLTPEGAPLVWPFLCITIACGAVSGFHSLVSSGTTSKQLSNESDAKAIGYGSMLLEGALAVLVIVAVTAGIGLAYESKTQGLLTGLPAWTAHYSSWTASAGLGSKLDAVVIGASNLMNGIGIPVTFGFVIMGVFIASFAGTTLDSATRIQRYVIAEIGETVKFNWLKNKYSATAFAVVSAAALAFSSGLNGKGALALWPLFGAVNQLLASLALLIATLYLKKQGGLKYLVTLIPTLFMLVLTFWATVLNQLKFIHSQQTVLIVLNGLILASAMLIVFEVVIVLFKSNKNLKPKGVIA